ncbi:MAG: type II toxin-antitoxin system RelE/ParE family toxin [Thermaceae bacterium]|nr:type II toxin-antitoxin system RelE/ParE family toxin [Thermaceae bacterium]
MKLELSTRAEANADSIAEQLRLSNPERAFEWTSKLMRLVDDLETFPEMGHIIPELENPRLHELILEGRYRVMCRLTGDEIQILLFGTGDNTLTPPLCLNLSHLA